LDGRSIGGGSVLDRPVECGWEWIKHTGNAVGESPPSLDHEPFRISEFPPMVLLKLMSPSKARHLIWVLFFAAQSWTLWTTLNKFVIDSVSSRRPAYCVFKTRLTLEWWRPLQRAKDLSMLGDAQEPLQSNLGSSLIVSLCLTVYLALYRVCSRLNLTC
jgi:hypothetical protein